MSSPRRGRQPRSTSTAVAAVNPVVWWQSPTVVLLLVVPAAIVPVFFVGQEEFRLFWRTDRTVTPEILLLLLVGGLTVALGATTVLSLRAQRPSAGQWPNLGPRQVVVLTRVGAVMLALTVLGYGAYLVAAMRSGLTFADVQNALGPDGLYAGQFKDAVPPIAGVTTLTQLGIPSVVISALLYARTRAPVHLLAMLLVVALAVPRALLLTERLAILELVVPIAVVLSAAQAARSQRRRRLVALLPVVAVPFVAVLFAAFEYGRSWIWFRDHTSLGFPEFAALRLIGYYATALNNGALQIAYNDRPSRWPFETVSAFWTAPGIEESHLYVRLSGLSQEERYLDILRTYGWEEFNNSSGLAAPFVDYGVVGGLVYMLGAGIVLGVLFRSFREGRLPGMLLYPVLFLGIIELPRVLAWPAGRLLPALFVLTVVAIAARHIGDNGPPMRSRSERSTLQHRMTV